MGQHCTGKKPVQCCPKRTRLTNEKIMCNVVLILLGEHSTGKNSVQCCPRGPRQQCTGKNPVQCCLNNIWSFFSDFYFGPVNLLIITGCCKGCANIAQISPTLHKKNPGLTLNKKTRLYGTGTTGMLVI